MNFYPQWTIAKSLQLSSPNTPTLKSSSAMAKASKVRRRNRRDAKPLSTLSLRSASTVSSGFRICCGPTINKCCWFWRIYTWSCPPTFKKGTPSSSPASLDKSSPNPYKLQTLPNTNSPTAPRSKVAKLTPSREIHSSRSRAKKHIKSK